MSGGLKKCLNCRTDLPENSNGATQCQKCQKNEAKYGKAVTCQFCQLNAAFHERKCVWCAHSERKFGDPVNCANCQLNCAFPKSEKARKAETKVLCRLCVMQAHQTKQTVLAGVPVSSDVSKKENNDSHRSSQKRKHKTDLNDVPTKYGRAGTTTNSAFGIIETETNAEKESHIKIQKLNDEISRLNAVIQAKDTQLMEKDKSISNLKADNYNQEKKHRERVQQLQKEKEESIRMIENIRTKATKKA